MTQKELNALLLASCINGNLSGVISALQNGANVNAKNKELYTALMLAAENDYCDIVRYLLHVNGIEVNVQNKYDNTALILAAQNGNLEMVETLFPLGLEKERGLALFFAASNNHLPVLRYLAERGVDLHTQDQWTKRTALTDAIIGNNLQVVQYILLRDPQKNHYMTAFKEAIVSNKLGIIKYLSSTVVEHFGVGSEDYNNLLSSVIGRNNVEILDTILSMEGIDINTKIFGEKTFFNIAIMYQSLAVVECCIKHGANIHVRDASNSTILMYAAGRGDLDIVRLLIKNGADIHLVNNDGYNALMFAALSRKIDLVKFLIAEGADEEIGLDKKTLLIKILDCKSFDYEIITKMVQVLLTVSDVNAQDITGKTALIYAAESNLTDVIPVLIAAGAATVVNGKDILYHALANNVIGASNLLLLSSKKNVNEELLIRKMLQQQVELMSIIDDENSISADDNTDEDDEESSEFASEESNEYSDEIDESNSQCSEEDSDSEIDRSSSGTKRSRDHQSSASEDADEPLPEQNAKQLRNDASDGVWQSDEEVDASTVQLIQTTYISSLAVDSSLLAQDSSVAGEGDFPS